MFNNLRRFIDKIKPNFLEGGKFAWLQSTFEAFETFAFTPNRVTKCGCHVRDAIDLKRAMITVVIALVPAMLFGMKPLRKVREKLNFLKPGISQPIKS